MATRAMPTTPPMEVPTLLSTVAAPASSTIAPVVASSTAKHSEEPLEGAERPMKAQPAGIPSSRMIRFIPQGRQCRALSSTGEQQTAAVQDGLDVGVTLEECLDDCRSDTDCFFAEFSMVFEEGMGRCLKFVSCNETEASQDLVLGFKKVSEGSFDSPQWMMQCPLGAALTTRCMSQELYDDVVRSIHELTESLSDECNADECEQADFAGCVLRMAGHDFMDYDPTSGTGGADGCTSMENADNAGLAECLYLSTAGSDGISVSLQDAYESFCSEVSLADFLVIAAEAIMSLRSVGESQQLLSTQFKANFWYGRTTGFEGCQFADHALPNPADSCVAVERVFVDALGLDWEMAAALMGVHTLGRAEGRLSGYSGWWSTPEHSRRFNNDYFVSMLAKSWCPEMNVNGCSDADAETGLCTAKNQWQRCDVDRDVLGQAHEMMLDTDLCLFYRDGASGDGVLRASEDNCCAWVHSFVPGFDMTEVIDANGGTLCNVPCGGSHPEIRNGSTFDCFKRSRQQKVAEFEACCFFETERADCRTVGLGDAGLSPGGPAEDAVHRFARNESVWLEVFLRAWHIVTTNGFGKAPSGSLKPLGSCP